MCHYRRQSRRDGRNNSSQTRAAFQEDIAVRAGSMWSKDGTAEDKWHVMRPSLTKAAESLLERESLGSIQIGSRRVKTLLSPSFST